MKLGDIVATVIFASAILLICGWMSAKDEPYSTDCVASIKDSGGNTFEVRGKLARYVSVD